MVMLPTLLIIGVPAKLVLWGERVGIECLISQCDSQARDYRTRQVAAIFRSSKRNLRASLLVFFVKKTAILDGWHRFCRIFVAKMLSILICEDCF